MTNKEIVELLKTEYLKSDNKLHVIDNAFYKTLGTDPMLRGQLPNIDAVIGELLNLDYKCNEVNFSSDVYAYVYENYPLDELISEWQL